jgi:hypothetical protein
MTTPRPGHTILGMVVLALLVAACSSSTKKSSSTTSAVPAPITAAHPTTTLPAPAGTYPTEPIPLGKTATTVEGWAVKVLSVESAADDSSNRKPPPGYAFMVYTIQVSRTDSPPEPANYESVSLVAPSKVDRSVASDPLCSSRNSNSSDLHQGGTATTGGCISVPTSDVGNLVLGYGSTWTTWFATK